MLTIDLTEAQATGLLALFEHVEHRAVDQLRIDPRLLAAMRRGVERFRDAVDGVRPPTDFDPLLEDLGATLDGLRDARVITESLERLHELVGAVRIAAGVERVRLAAARRGELAYSRWADGVLDRFGAGDPRWLDAAVTLLDDICAPGGGDDDDEDDDLDDLDDAPAITARAAPSAPRRARR
ncbi:MAG: hypothetical protein R3F65_05885 [bacterium]